jgi:BirA family biotin operon repressor/biotin-[acetyl-CoA-carboxylase] ligase
MRDRPLEAWPDALERACDETRHIRQVRVLRETASTQDAALACKVDGGLLVTAGRQTAGRGRLGSAWADTASEGVACTFAVSPRSIETLSIAAAVAVALAARDVLPVAQASSVGLKWPNDLLARCGDGALRKLAGVLIEVREGRALIGVGINVLQSGFPDDLGDRAVSLAQLGSVADRLQVIEHLLLRMDEALSMEPVALAARFTELDRTVGLRLRFQSVSGPVEGVVLRCDAMRGLEVRTGDGPVWLPAATTRVEAGVWGD